MDTHVSRVQTASAASGRLVCWLESLIVGLGIPAAIWIISKLISLSIPAAVHGSAEQRFLLWILGGVIVEWVFVVVVWFVLRTRGSSFKDIGAPICSSFDRQQSPVPAPNAYSYLVCVHAAWISPCCRSSFGNHRWIL
jgi:hypothetical protein